jgi:hypothetical protein
MNLLNAALTLGATVRLTRLVINDDIGEWWIRDPLDAWVHQTPARMRHHKYVEGLTCPYCVGYWIGAAVLASHAALGHTRLWRYVMASLTLNEVSAYVYAWALNDDHEEQL